MGRAIGVLGSAKVVNFGVLRGTSVRRVLRSIRCYWEDSGGTGVSWGGGYWRASVDWPCSIPTIWHFYIRVIL